MTESSNSYKQSIYKQLILQETQHRVVRKIPMLNKEQLSTGTGVGTVETMMPDGSRETHSPKVEIEDMCIEENKQQFLQTNDTLHVCKSHCSFH